MIQNNKNVHNALIRVLESIYETEALPTGSQYLSINTSFIGVVTKGDSYQYTIQIEYHKVNKERAQTSTHKDRYGNTAESQIQSHGVEGEGAFTTL